MQALRSLWAAALVAGAHAAPLSSYDVVVLAQPHGGGDGRIAVDGAGRAWLLYAVAPEASDHGDGLPPPPPKPPDPLDPLDPQLSTPSPYTWIRTDGATGQLPVSWLAADLEGVLHAFDGRRITRYQDAGWVASGLPPLSEDVAVWQDFDVPHPMVATERGFAVYGNTGTRGVSSQLKLHWSGPDGWEQSDDTPLAIASGPDRPRTVMRVDGAVEDSAGSRFDLVDAHAGWLAGRVVGLYTDAGLSLWWSGDALGVLRPVGFEELEVPVMAGQRGVRRGGEFTTTEVVEVGGRVLVVAALFVDRVSARAHPRRPAHIEWGEARRSAQLAVWEVRPSGIVPCLRAPIAAPVQVVADAFGDTIGIGLLGDEHVYLLTADVGALCG